MAQLVYEITGTVNGLAQAASQATGILANLQRTADALSVKLFEAGTEQELNAIGGALTIVTGKINEYTTAAIQGSQAFKDQSAQSALDALATKLSVLTGNAQLFGDSIKNQTTQLAAYQQALNKVLAAGFDPLDSKVIALKTDIDRLTTSINAQKVATAQAAIAAKNFSDPFAKFATTGSLIKDAENKVKNLGTALQNATSERDIAQYNVRLGEAQDKLTALKGIGTQTATSLATVPATLTDPAVQSATTGFFNSFRTGFGYIRQLAYILPGIGIAGIFNLGFEAIAKATEGIDLFNTKLDVAKQTQLAFNGVLEDTAKNSAGAEANFKILTSAIQDTTKSFKDRIEAAEELKNQFPQELVNTSALTLVNGGLKDSIDNITKSIYKQAEAEAFITAIKDEEAKKGALLAKQAEIQAKANTDISLAVAPIRQQATGSSLTGVVLPQTITVDQQKKGIQDLADFRKNKIQPEIDVINKVIEQLINQSNIDGANLAKSLDGTNKLIQDPLKNFNSIIKASGNKNDFENLEKALQKQLDSLTPGDPDIKKLRDKIQEVKDIIKNAYDVKPTKVKAYSETGLSQNNFEDRFTTLQNSSGAAADQSGLTGEDLDLQKIEDKYKSYYSTLDGLRKDLDASTKISDKNRLADEQAIADQETALAVGKAKEIADAQAKEAERAATSIQRINDEFGVKSNQTRAKELASIQVLYDNEIAKAQGNEEIIDTIRAGRIVADKAVEDKYAQIVSDTYDKIGNIVQQANNGIVDIEQSRTGKIVLQYDKLRQEANKYYQLLRMQQAEGSPKLAGVDINGQQAQTNALLNKAESTQISIVLSANFSKALQSSIDTFASDFYTSITTLGKARQDIDTKYALQLDAATDQTTRDQINKLKDLEQATTTSFGAIFGDLVTKFNQSFSQSLFQGFVKKITENLGNTLITPKLAGVVDPGVTISNAASTFSQVIIEAGQTFATLAKGGAATVSTSGATLAADGSSAGAAVASGGANASVGLSKGGAALAAAASIAGNIISGLGKPTNYLTSGLGGAVSGAGTGALIGSAVPGLGTVAGAVIGGAIGLIGGIFSASKANKALQEQQLEQQKEQTELLKQSLAYTSSIIGRMTASGVVTGVDVNAFGELTATVSGNSLKFIISRANQSRA